MLSGHDDACEGSRLRRSRWGRELTPPAEPTFRTPGSRVDTLTPNTHHQTGTTISASARASISTPTTCSRCRQLLELGAHVRPPTCPPVRRARSFSSVADHGPRPSPLGLSPPFALLERLPTLTAGRARSRARAGGGCRRTRASLSGRARSVGGVLPAHLERREGTGVRLLGRRKSQSESLSAATSL